MTLIATSGASDANAYASVGEADSFHQNRDENAAWTAATTEQKESALIRATDFIDAAYVFRSVPASAEQALENPRFREARLHPRLVKATILLAIHMLSHDSNHADDENRVNSESKSLAGVGSKTISYFEKKADRYPLITKVLAPLANRRNSSFGISRMTNP